VHHFGSHPAPSRPHDRYWPLKYNAVDLLRIILAYCLGERGLRSTAAWASAVGLVDMSNVALLYRLRRCGDWLTMLVGRTLAFDAPKAAQGRLIRLIDATTVPKAGTQAKMQNKLWRIHSAFDLPSERFGFFELTDERGGERLDRIPVVEGEILIGDRAYLQPDRIGEILEAGADIDPRIDSGAVAAGRDFGGTRFRSTPFP
jgi:hypothetical protein